MQSRGRGRASRPQTKLFAAALSIAPAACVGPNPYLDDDGDTGTGNDEVDTTATSTDTDTSSSTDTDTDTDTGTETGPAHCGNGSLDGDESDLDCGGSCVPCEDGLSCGVPEDCASLVCESSLCRAPTCDDGVQNGDELEVDCGGSACGFCQHSDLKIELDDFQGSSARLPVVAMFPDHSLAISYVGPDSARLRWFDEFADPMGPSVEVSSSISFTFNMNDNTPVHLALDGQPEDLAVLALEAGMDGVSQSADLFAVERSPEAEQSPIRVNDLDALVKFGDLDREGQTATFVWQEDNQIWLRRLDLDIGEGGWLDISALAAETEPGSFVGNTPRLTRGLDGVQVVAWVRCDQMNSSSCSVAVRRYDAGWLDPEPVVVSTELAFFSNVELARDAEGRTFVTWVRFLPGDFAVRARMLTADSSLDGARWDAQAGLSVAPDPAVVALSDGSFALAWDDNDQDRVHLRRYVGPDTPKLPGVGDEAPWPPTMDPFRVSMASVDNHLAVVWSATVDMVPQLQGQVLSF